jgi:thiol-disulfide isomerase/thioredoxin
MTITYFYTNECGKCAELKPLITAFSQATNIKMVNTHEDDLLTESYKIEWVPTLVIEDQNGKHYFDGVNEIKEVLKKLIE